MRGENLNETDLLREATAKGADAEEAARPSGRATSNIPPGVEAAMVTQAIQQHYQEFLGHSIPALQGMTPRQAAKHPRMRAKLIDLMKMHISKVDEMFQDLPSSSDLDWVLEELGLDELMDRE